MILYEKKFRLSNNVSFSHYIKSLDEMNFSPYTLLISEIPFTNDFRIEIEITNFITGYWGWHNVFSGGILFNECIVKHSKGDKFFTLQGSIGTGNFLLVIFYIVIPLLFFCSILSMMFTKGTSIGNLFIAILVAAVLSGPAILTYIREKKFLDRIGSIGSELYRR